MVPGTPLLVEAERGEFSPLSEQEMLAEPKTFVEHLTCDCSFITHHTVSDENLTGPHFLQHWSMRSGMETSPEWRLSGKASFRCKSLQLSNAPESWSFIFHCLLTTEKQKAEETAFSSAFSFKKYRTITVAPE